MRTSYARQHCQSSSADIPATYVREYTTYREAETLQLAIELVLSTVKYLQRAHASYMYMYIPVPTCTYVRSIAIGTCVARREGSVRAWSYAHALRTRTNMRVTRTWYTRGTRVRLLSFRWAVLYMYTLGHTHCVLLIDLPSPLNREVEVEDLQLSSSCSVYERVSEHTCTR